MWKREARSAGFGPRVGHVAITHTIEDQSEFSAPENPSDDELSTLRHYVILPGAIGDCNRFHEIGSCPIFVYAPHRQAVCTTSIRTIRNPRGDIPIAVYPWHTQLE